MHIKKFLTIKIFPDENNPNKNIYIYFIIAMGLNTFIKKDIYKIV